ncbi:MAG TPA: hypothetical protein VK741_05610 [Acetobacteraceae bacterium]|jgi:phage tail tape-measure protein|nr:hypothetical protein [Acetobacteraceae bacterium]
MRALSVAAIAALTILAACGSQQPDRATGGAATGAGTGAVIGLVGGPVGVGVGALIGAAVGATTGATVPPPDFTLPPPPWSSEPANAVQTSERPQQPSM